MVIRERIQKVANHYALSFGGFEDFCHDQLRIIPKGGGLTIPLVLNKHQQHVISEMEKQWDTRRLTRLIILKSRRIGMSTLSCAWTYRQTVLFPYVNSRIIAQNDDTTQQLWRFISTFQESVSPYLVPKATTESTHALGWNTIKSALSLATAGSRTGGRGGTYQNLLLSEAAFYPATFKWKANWLPTVNTEPFTSIIIESTAFGQGGDFHGFWNAAMKGDIDYLPIFLPWHWGTDNRTTPEEYDARHKGLIMTREETELAEQFQLDKHQIAWRRDEMAHLEQEAEDGGDPFDLFHQEHPSTPEEAFLFSGMPVFSQASLLKAKNAARRPMGRFEIDADNGKVSQTDRGRLWVWEWPNPDHRYGIGADVAEGLAHGDNSAAYVVDFVTGKTVAAWVSNDVDPDLYGRYLYRLGHLYGHKRAGVAKRRAALMAVERNGPGGETIRTLERLRYPFIWVYEDPSHPIGDKGKSRGFRTTMITKPFLIAQLRSELRDHPEAMVDPLLVKEMGTYIKVPQPTRRDKPGRMEASPGNKDDRVIARALAALVYREETGKVLTTDEDKQAVKRAAEETQKRERGKKLTSSFFRSRSSNPDWKVKEKPRTLDDIEKVIEEMEKNKPIFGKGRIR